MPSKKRKPSKSMRQQRNRAQRARAEARSQHAGEATAISKGEAEPVSSPSRPTERAGAQPAAEKQDSPTETRELTPRQVRQQARAKALAERYPIPGQRWIMMSFLFAVVTAGLLAITPLQFSDELPADDPRVIEATDGDGDGKVTLEPDDEGGEEIEVDADDPRAIAQELEEGEEEGTYLVPRDSRLFSEFDLPIAIALAGIPILITGIAYRSTKTERRSTIWTVCLVAYAGYIFLFASGIGILALPAMVALMIGNYQSRKADTMLRVAEQRAKAEAAGDGDVIDVDGAEVDDARKDD